MSTSKNAKKRRQQVQAKQRREAAGDARPPSADRLPPASDDVIEPSEPGPIGSVADPRDDRDGPGFTAAKGGAANWVIVAVMIAIMAVALVAVFR